TPAFYKRLQTVLKPTKKQLKTIEAQDIPDVYDHSEAELRELAELVGLEKIKGRVNDYLNVVRLSKRRMEMGLSTTMPRLHMVFLGNPGTGKTTVAQIIGKVFASWGILSNGSVISTEKSKMVGQYIGETEMKMNQLLAQARGNVLFIDEAYQLAEGGEKDFGRVVMDSLLTELGKDNLDMVVILAGYTAPMKRLMESNEGIESRFPNVFNFEDYSADELVEIAKMMAKKQGFSLAKGVEEKISAIIQEEYEKPSARFGNARFVSNLLQNDILATMGKRTAALPNPTKKDLCLILPEDVIIGKKRKDVVFDDIAINAALARLDRMAGLDNVKKAIHGFVQSVRYLHSRGEDYVGKGLLSWRFVGNTGTGKSTVAEIMAEILKGMRLIANSHIVEIKGERILNVSDYDCDQVLREAVKTSCNGLIFIDVDTPECAESQQRYGRSIEFIRMKIKELTVEVGGECALIVAEMKGSAPNGDVAERLSDAGVYDCDHTLVFKDYTPGELFQILCICLQKHDVVFTPQAEAHMRKYLEKFTASGHANARTMKTMSRTIYRQVILRESGMEQIPDVHQVLLQDVGTFSWDSNKGKIGFKVTKK
ncbi:MAG: AAA family ATPase, partial [Bacteroidales bacterium]|nr:AAA family ATPase [Bacteroidales bacterium]